MIEFILKFSSFVCFKFIFSFLIMSDLTGLTLPYPYPIGFSLPESKIVSEIPVKDQDFAFNVPGRLETYIYNKESDYYRDFQRSYFAITMAKGGWDCLRHYEILANGCIPYFLNLEACPENTMFFLPKDLIKEAMSLEGVSQYGIDHHVFDKNKYFEILNKLLEHTRKYLTTKNMAKHILDSVGYSGTGKILYLGSDHGKQEFCACLNFIGLKQLLGDRVIDVPKLDYAYKSYPADSIGRLYGRGFSYTRMLEDSPIDRENIEQRIKDKEFDLVIFGNIHWGLHYFNLVRQVYESNRIVYLCTEDQEWHIVQHHSKDAQCDFLYLNNFFLREAGERF